MAKSIMIQGTMSNVGKSLLTAGLCRIFRQDGYKTAPFKSQNMALNSFITEDGLEMGRAQAVQAEAAGIKPSVLMNPILLKPASDYGSQVIVNGEVIGTMPAREYFEYKKQLKPEVIRAYNELAKEYDIIVIEGAGSPAEINLKAEDIVNMGMARIAQAPVLLVGDIDRGGVFASLLGTLMLLEEEEKAMVKGCVVNKFRGDKTILDPGLPLLEGKIHVPLLGVVPYMQVDIDEEDSLSERITGEYLGSEKALIDICVIRFPRMSNYTDFNAFSRIPGVSLRYVSEVAKLGNPDLILLPGTKSTFADCLWMRQNGLEAAIKKMAAAGKVIFGICGGYQMLGQKLSDPEGNDASTGVREIRGIGLLPVETVFEAEKTRTLVKGHLEKMSGCLKTLSGCSIEGYEIHMGKTVLLEGQPFALLSEVQSDSQIIKSDGCQVKNVYGTYIHGIFDSAGMAEEIINCLRLEKGFDYKQFPSFNIHDYKEQQYDKLAEVLRNSLDMKRIYSIIEEGI